MIWQLCHLTQVADCDCLVVAIDDLWYEVRLGQRCLMIWVGLFQDIFFWQQPSQVSPKHIPTCCDKHTGCMLQSAVLRCTSKSFSSYQLPSLVIVNDGSACPAIMNDSQLQVIHLGINVSYDGSMLS
jgi:hypothetical protein